MAEIPQLRADGRNWTEYREKLLRVAAQQNLDRLYDGTETLQGDAEDWQQRNAIAKVLIVNTIPDSIFLRILHFESAYEFFKALKNLFEQDIATLELLRELRNNRTKREAAYSPQTANDRVRTRNVGDASRCDDDVSNRSVRQNNDVPRRQVHVPSNEPRPERKREPTSQGRVEKRSRVVGEKGRVSRGRDDEGTAAATGPGKGATDHTADGVSLIKPTSSQDSPRARVDTPPSPPLPPTTPTIPVDQMAPASRRSNDQRRWDGRVPRTETHRTHEDGEGSRRGVVESRNRGSRAVDEDGEDVHVHHAHVEPQQPQTTRQTAVDDEAADTTDPHANSAGPAVPVGTTNEPSNGVDEGVEEGDRRVEAEDEKGGRASGSAAPSSNDDGGDEDVRHAYVVPKPATSAPYHVPPSPDERRPPSVPLEGEMTGKQSSGHADEAATHLERPPDESTTQLPGRTPYDQTSNGEGRGEAVNGDDEVEVEGSKDDDRKASNGVDGRQRRNDEASRDEGSREVDREVEGSRENTEEGREVEETTDEGEEGRTSVQARSTTNVDGHGQYTPNKGNSPQEPPPPFPHHPEPPPVPTPTPPAPAPTPPTSPYPERPHVDVDHTKSNKTPARRRADAVHDPGGETKKPPSVRLEGESGRRSRLTTSRPQRVG
jgi:hypothetical protein